jgi:hypothetical protein
MIEKSASLRRMAELRRTNQILKGLAFASVLVNIILGAMLWA